MSTNDLFRIIDLIRHDLDALEEAARHASAVQWEPAPRSRANPLDVRSRGGHTDPTGDAAVDPPRLRVRDALRSAERDVARILRDVRSVAGRVQHAVARWEGPPPSSP